MEPITVTVGDVVELTAGMTEDGRRAVTFVGEKIGVLVRYGEHKGRRTDTRGVTQTLYRAEDGRLVVHVEKWSRWQGEPTTETLTAVTEADLSVGGSYEALGRECGFGRPLTLDEALTAAA